MRAKKRGTSARIHAWLKSFRSKCHGVLVALAVERAEPPPDALHFLSDDWRTLCTSDEPHGYATFLVEDFKASPRQCWRCREVLQRSDSGSDWSLSGMISSIRQRLRL